MRTLGTWFGGLAAIGGLEHGYFELQQGGAAPPGLMFSSMGPPCVPGDVWYACEPAMTVIPNLALTGLLAIGLGAVTLVWVGAFMRQSYGGWVLALLSAALLLFGGGIVPPVIGIVGGVLAAWSPRPASGATGLRRALAALWPWSLVAFFVLLFGTVAVGLVSNDLVEAGGLVILVAFPAAVVLAALSAWAQDSLRPDAG